MPARFYFDELDTEVGHLVGSEPRQNPSNTKARSRGMSQRAAGIAPDNGGGHRLHQPVAGLL